MSLVFILAFLSAVASCAGQPQPPFPNPMRPAPFWSWDTLPRAFHGANRSGMFTADDVSALSNYSLVTIEKWYTPCGAQRPSQSGPACDVEDKMFSTFRQLKAIAPAHTNIMYLNSMFDFAFYHLNGLILDREAAGERLLLRDARGELVVLCNDGNVYCNVTNFDWTVPEMLALWQAAVSNASSFGGVDGIFADHGDVSIQPVGNSSVPQLCNGSGALRTCWNFTQPFADAFNTAHKWLLNATQDALSRLPGGGGPVVDGPYSRWDVEACEYSALRPVVEEGVAGDGAFVIEANRGGTCSPTESCIANFLAAAEKYTYLMCMADGPAPAQPEFAYALGPPTGPPVESNGIVTRSFLSSAGLTNVSVVIATSQGTVQWAGAPPAPPSPPDVCGTLPPNTAVAQFDVAVHDNVADPAACCDLCAANDACAIWCFHGEPGPQHNKCHLHSSHGVEHAFQGATSGVYNRTR